MGGGIFECGWEGVEASHPVVRGANDKGGATPKGWASPPTRPKTAHRRSTGRPRAACGATKRLSSRSCHMLLRPSLEEDQGQSNGEIDGLCS
jgi:hypothetical protein